MGMSKSKVERRGNIQSKQRIPLSKAIIASLAVSNNRPNSYGRAGGRAFRTPNVFGVSKERAVRSAKESMVNTIDNIIKGMLETKSSNDPEVQDYITLSKDLQNSLGYKTEEPDTTTIRSLPLDTTRRSGLKYRSKDVGTTSKSYKVDWPSDELPDIPEDTTRPATTTSAPPRRRRAVRSTKGKSADLFYTYNYGGYYNAPRR